MPGFSGGGIPLSADGAQSFADLTGAGAAEMWSVLSVETTGCGFLQDKRPKILFERHKFHALTRGAFDVSHPDISQPTAGGYGLGGANQYNRLAVAITLDRPSALKSASWGLGQILGMNFHEAGFADVETMITSTVESEDNQLAAMASFLSATHLARPLAQHDWTQFALGYNGPDFAKNNYDGLLAHFFNLYSRGPLPDITVRGVQMLLSFRGFDPRGIDGVMGGHTRQAIIAFQAQAGMAQTGAIDDDLLGAL